MSKARREMVASEVFSSLSLLYVCAALNETQETHIAAKRTTTLATRKMIKGYPTSGRNVRHESEAVFLYFFLFFMKEAVNGRPFGGIKRRACKRRIDRLKELDMPGGVIGEAGNEIGFEPVD